MIFKWNSSVLFLVLLVSLLVSCPNPFSKDLLLTLQDLNPPVITIDSPSQGALFESSLTVTGTIIDVDSEGNCRGTTKADEYISSASYIVKNQDTDAIDLSVGTDGSFSFTVSTAEYDTQITIEITAVDINENEVVSSVIFDPDTDGPNLVLTSPVDYSEYATVIQLSGYVTNSLGSDSFSEVNHQVSYTMPGTDISGELTLNEENGTFSTVLDVSALEGSRTIEVTALDLNGNDTILVCTITKPAEGGDISGFHVVPGNRQVTICWDDVLFAESYTLFETNFGVTKENVTSPYVWDDLENGEIYNFSLTANLPAAAGESAISNSISKMPLSPLTLTPRISASGYGSISLEWRDLPQVTSYTVERSTSASGPWSVRRNLSNSTFTDDRVDSGINYYYRILPAECSDIPSDAASSIPGMFGRAQLGEIDFKSSSNAIAVSGNYAYICQGSTDGLYILDISDPEHPGNPISIMNGVPANDVEVLGNYAFIVSGTAGSCKLAIVNVSNPLMPRDPIYVDINDYAQGVTVSGNSAYVAATFDGLAIIDVADKTNPGTVRYIPDYGVVRCVASSGNYLFAGAGASLYILDISADPENPTLVDTVNLTADNSADKIYSIVIKENTAYLSGDFHDGSTFNGMALIDISDPSHAGSPVYAEIANGTRRLAVSGSYAYVSTGMGSFQIVDLSDPSAPKYIETVESKAFAYDIAVSGRYAYITDFNGGMAVIDIANPTDPATPFNIPTAGECGKIRISGNTAIILDYDNGLASVDITDPQHPGTPDYFYTPATTINGCEISSHYVFLDIHSVGLRILDIADLNTPEEMATLDVYSRNYTVSGSYLYIADGAAGLKTYNISDPANPGEPVTLSLGFDAIYITVSGNYAYSLGNGDFACIDISDSSNPVLMDHMSIGSKTARGITVSGNYAYIPLSSCEFAIIDISDPASLGIADFISLESSSPSDVEITGDYAFFAVGNNGLAIVDILDPENPGAPLFVDTSDYTYDAAISGSYAYVANSTDGLAIIPLLGDE